MNDEKIADGGSPKRSFWGGNLRLEKLTRAFVALNLLDLVMTFFLLNHGGFRESNQLADYFLSRWGIAGMVYYKIAFVMVLVLVAQFIASRKIQAGRFLLVVGCLLVGGVVVYSFYLYLAFGGNN